MGFQDIAQPKRSLGQNFFVNQNLGDNIVKKVLETQPELIIEIGPGKGFFTERFLQIQIPFIAIEKDDLLAEQLKFLHPQLTIYNKDVLDLDLNEIIPEGKKVTVYGSLPYNVSKKIIEQCIKNEKIQNCVFIIQKEVAERYTAKNRISSLSLLTSIYANSKILLQIPPEAFKPKPHVESALILFSKREKSLTQEEIKSFRKYLDIVFKQPRKMLRNNLKNYYSLDSISETFLNNRAESMNLEDHLTLWHLLSKNAI